MITFFAPLVAATTIFGHCGKCSVDGKSEGEHAHHQESACSDAQLTTYFEVQAGLANDDLSAAQAASKNLLAMGEEMGCSLDGKECCSSELSAASDIVESTNIAGARQAFKSWSDALIAKVERGLPESAVAYKMHCPMAFGNQGGSWLQGSEDLRNPYFGAMMLKCGVVKDKYGRVSEKDFEKRAGKQDHR